MAPGDVARLYHRLSSYWHVPGTEWPPPIDHPLVRQDFVPNHRPTFPPIGRPTPTVCRRSSCRRHGLASRHRQSRCWPGATRRQPGRWTSRGWPASSTFRRASCGSRCAGTGAGSCSGRPGRQAASFHSSCTSLRTRCAGYPTASTGTTLSTTRFGRWDRRPRARRRRSLLPGSPGGRAGGIRNAGSAISTGTAARCSPTRFRSPSRVATRLASTRASRTRPSPGWWAPTGSRSSRWPS